MFCRAQFKCLWWWNQQQLTRALTDEFVPSLKKLFASEDWTVRANTAKILGRMKSPLSLKTLQDQLFVETDDEVKTAIIAALKAARI